jgi:hypothetical protein
MFSTMSSYSKYQINGRGINDHIYFYTLIATVISFVIVLLLNSLVCGISFVIRDHTTEHSCRYMSNMSIAILRYVRK